MANDIKYLKATDAVSSSVDIINNNFRNLKDAISAGNINISKYDKEIQALITNLEENFSNVTAIYNTLDINEEKWNKTVKELETTAENLNGDIARATLQLKSEITDAYTRATVSLGAAIESDTSTVMTSLTLLADSTVSQATAIANLTTTVSTNAARATSGLETLSTITASSIAAQNKLITSIQTSTVAIEGGLNTLATKTSEIESQVNELYSRISGVDGEDIYAGVRTMASRIGDLENAVAGLTTSIDDAESNISSLTTKTSQFTETMNNMSSSIGDVEATITTCVTKNSDGYIESGIKLSANQIDFVGKTINFTGTGTFNGDVIAQSFTVDNSNGYEAIKFKVWESSDASLYGSANITVGTPVFIATTYNSDGTINKQYVANMLELNTGTSGTVFLQSVTSVDTTSSSATATILCKSMTYNNTIIDVYNNGTHTYKLNSTDGNVVSGSYIRLVKEPGMYVKIDVGGLSIGNYYLGYLDTCYRIEKYTFNNGSYSCDYYYCIPEIYTYTVNRSDEYNENVDYYVVEYSSTRYRFVKNIETIAQNTYKWFVMSRINGTAEKVSKFDDICSDTLDDLMVVTDFENYNTPLNDVTPFNDYEMYPNVSN